MDKYEQRVRESIKDCKTLEEVIDILEDWEWPIQMKDVWNHSDHQAVDLLLKIRKEETKKWNEKNQ
jgi:hypothetical protein